MAASEEADRKRFEEWKKEHNKSYDSPDEEEIRFSAFQENLRDIEEHLADKSLRTHWKGLNYFSDMTFCQFLTEHMGMYCGPSCYVTDSDTDSDCGPWFVEDESPSKDGGERKRASEGVGEGKGAGEGDVSVKHQKIV